jgi:hypothetical protein
MEANLGRVPSEACAEMATDPVPKRKLRRQETLWRIPAFLREVCRETWPTTGIDGHA